MTAASNTWKHHVLLVWCCIRAAALQFDQLQLTCCSCLGTVAAACASLVLPWVPLLFAAACVDANEIAAYLCLLLCCALLLSCLHMHYISLVNRTACSHTA